MRNSILLIRPPAVMKGTSFIATQFPLNIASLAASLLRKGYDVRIRDFDVESFDRAAFEESLKVLSPFMVGISCYTPTVINGHRIATVVKQCLPNVLTVVGGPHVSALPVETLTEFKNFDIGVIGEGEEVMVELADKTLSREPIEAIDGIIYRTGGTLRRTAGRAPIKDIDKLPFPARHLLNGSLYKGQAHRGFSRSFLNITELMTSRGCPNRCIFCASEVVMGKGVRFRSADLVKREIRECVKKHGFNHFTISDDTFTLNENRLYDICAEFARSKVTWNCNARAWPISKKMLSAMARSGCAGITFGVESGSPRILKLIRKNVTLEQIENAFKWAKESGIKLVEADIIIGSHPSETKADLNMTRRLLSRVSPDIAMISIIVPYPGTAIYNMMRAKKLLLKGARWDSFVLYGREPSWRTECFGPKELVSLQKKMMRNFYFRPLYVLRMLRKMTSLKEVAYWFGGGMDFILNSVKMGGNRPIPESDGITG